MKDCEYNGTSAEEKELMEYAEQYRKDRMINDDLLNDLRIDDDHYDDEDRESMAGHMRHWSIIALFLGIVFGFLYYKRHAVMTLEESRMTLIGAVVLIAASALFLIAEKAGRKKGR